MPRRRDTDAHFETDFAPPETLRADRAIHVSADGRRAVTGLLNVRPQKRSRTVPNDLEDTYTEWTPVPEDDLDEVQAVTDTVSTLDVVPDNDVDSAKRKRYQSSVRARFNWVSKRVTDANLLG
jgi:hypothetical protein